MIPRRNRDLPFGRNSFLFSYKRRYNGNLCACSVQQAKAASSMMTCTLSAPAAYFLSTTVLCARTCLRRHTFCQQQEKWAKAHTAVSADFQPRCGVKIGTLPRNHLASSATGGASAVSARNQWFLEFLSLQEFRSLWDVVSIDSATDPLLLPLR